MRQFSAAVPRAFSLDPEGEKGNRDERKGNVRVHYKKRAVVNLVNLVF